MADPGEESAESAENCDLSVDSDADATQSIRGINGQHNWTPRPLEKSWNPMPGRGPGTVPERPRNGPVLSSGGACKAQNKFDSSDMF